MTKDFNKQPRNGERPSFRNRPSNKQEDERSPRPRLNREAVDRAWESGAQTQHADYRPRRNGPSGGNERPYGNRRPYGNDRPSGERSSNSYGNRRPYGNDNGYGERSSNDYGNRRPYNNDRPSGGRSFNEQRSYGPRSGSERPYDNRSQGNRSYGNDRSYGDRPNRSSDNDRSYGNRPYGRPYNNQRSYESSDERRGGYNSRPGYNAERPPFDRSRNPRYQGNNDRPYEDRRQGNFRQDGPPRARGNQFQNQERSGQERFEGRRRPERDFQRNERPFPAEQRGPRSQDYDSPPRRDFPEPRRTQGRFEGDYEGIQDEFARPETKQPNAKPRKRNTEQTEEIHVTPMADGRVLKGSRSEQRKQERFWNDINEDTEELVNKIHIVEKEEPASASVSEPVAEQAEVSAVEAETPLVEGETQEAAPKATRSKKKAPERPPVIRPSQRGFKWPTP